MRLSDEERIALATLRTSLEWETVEAIIRRRIKRLEGDLGDTNFENLAQVARIQGARQELKDFLNLVEAAYRASTGKE